MDVDFDKIMNHWKEPYPENLHDLLGHADKLALEISEKLNSDKCKKINELYFWDKSQIKRDIAKFNELGYTPNSYLKSKSKRTEDNEFKGLYIFGEQLNGEIIPVYIGISRTIFRRLKQHAWGKKHNECTLAYLKTRERGIIENIEIGRTTVTNEDMLPAKKIIQNYKVALIEVQNDYDLYFLEVVLAGKFKTKWNSFKTH
jgi:predicted GIY-YIG superfamily endonuclease